MAFEKTKDFGIYKDFLDFIKEEDFFYKGISLFSPSAIYIYDLFWNKKRKIGSFLYEFIAILFKRLNTHALATEAKCKETSLCSFDFPQRKDHKSLCDMISRSIRDSRITTLSYYYLPIFNLFDFFRLFKEMKAKLKRINRQYSLRNLFLAIAYMLYTERVIDSLHKNIKRNDIAHLKLFIPFCSSAYTEATITLYMNKLGIRIAHIFHGLFGRYLHHVANDVVNGMNITAKEIWAFSEAQKEDLVRDFKLNPKIIYVMGNPKYPERKISLKKEFKNCIVFGPIPSYDEQFKQLLTLLNSIHKNHNINFTIKPHPLSTLNYSSLLEDIVVLNQRYTISELLQSNQYDGAITYNTFCYYECLYWGILPLRWGVDENIDYLGLDDKFYDKESFLNLTKQKSKETTSLIEEEIDTLLQKCIGYNINNIVEIINKSREDDN